MKGARTSTLLTCMFEQAQSRLGFVCTNQCQAINTLASHLVCTIKQTVKYKQSFY